MTNSQKLTKNFSDALNIEESSVTDNLQYNSIEQWDSVAHMALIAKIEECFDIMLDTNDIIDLSSPEKARHILIKYGIKF